MNTIDYRPAILARLDDWDSDHDMTGCPGGTRCLHAAAVALRALVAVHGPAAGLGRENTCSGCQTTATFTWLERCPVVLLIASELGLIPTNSSKEGDR